MKTTVDFEEHAVDKEKRQKKIESKKRDKVKSAGKKKIHSVKITETVHLETTINTTSMITKKIFMNLIKSKYDCLCIIKLANSYELALLFICN